METLRPEAAPFEPLAERAAPAPKRSRAAKLGKWGALLALAAALGPSAASCNSGESLLHAGQIENRFQVVGGPVAFADVGDYILENDQIRVAILGSRDSPGPGVFGGSIIDMDIRRPRMGFEDGQGRDRFAEAFPIGNLLVPDPKATDITVIQDGSDGLEATIRVEGAGEFLYEALGILELANVLLGRPIRSELRFRTDYTLRPGDRHVTMTTTVILPEFAVDGCTPLGCATKCEFGYQEDASGCLCACREALPLDVATKPVSVFGTIFGEAPAPGGMNPGVVAGDFVFFGNQNDVFAPGVGFDEDAAVQDAANIGQNSFQEPLSFDFVAAAGGDVSYGYFNAPIAGGEPAIVNVPLFASAATAFLAAQRSCSQDSADDLECDHSRAFSYVRYLAVGDGDVASVTEEMYRVRGTKTGTLRGNVYWQETTEPAKNAQLFVFADPDPKRTFKTVDELAEANRAARGDVGLLSAVDADVGLDLVEDGDFRAPLPAGDYVLVARDADMTATSVPQRVRIATGQETIVTPTLPTPATITFRVTDGAGQPMPAKVALVSLDGNGRALEGDGLRRPYVGEGRLGGGQRALTVTHNGEGSMQVEPGRYRAVVSRGIEYSIAVDKDFTVGPGQARRVDAALIHEVDTSGWMSADMHLHSRPSFDSGMQLDRRVTTAAAEGVEFAISTDHDVETDYRPVLQELGMEPYMKTAIGAEITTLEQGHFIGFPLKYDELIPTHGAHDWTCEPGGEILDAIRKTGDGGDAFTILAHPRDGFFGYVDQLGVDTYTMNRKLGLLEENNPIFRTASCAFDAMELISAKRLDLTRTPTVSEVIDWTRCLGRVNASTNPEELAAACPEAPDWPAPDCGANERFPACKARSRTKLAWTMTKRVLEKTPEEQDADWLFPGTQVESQAACDIDTIPGAVPEGLADQPCTYRAGQVDDYFRYLEHGMIRTQIGSSDSHNAAREAGYPRTYFKSPTDSPAAVSVDDLTASLKAGTAFATYGPFVRATIGEATFGQVASAKPGQTIELSLEVQTASWFGVDRVEVYKNGRIERVITRAPDPTAVVDVRGKVTMEVPDRDSWVVIIAMGLADQNLLSPVSLEIPFGEIQLAKVAGDAFALIPEVAAFFKPSLTVPDWSPIPPYAVTNPIYIDTDGNGVYDAPLPPPDFCSIPCNSVGDPCPDGQTCLTKEKLCGVQIGGVCAHRRVVPKSG